MDGIIIINKPKNCTSHDIVRKAKKILNEKVGHTGTLDPNATGVLPLLIGKGTQISKYIINHDKVYEAVLQLGTKTDTADVEGKIIEEKTVTERALEKENIEKVLEELTGEQEQIPPMYSAIKVNGKKLYELARAGKEIEREPRAVHIDSIDIIEYDEASRRGVMKVDCEKGTYIRSVISDIGEKLGCSGMMTSLERSYSGGVDIKDCYTIEEIAGICEQDKLSQVLIPLDRAFVSYEKTTLGQWETKLYRNGVKLRPEQTGIKDLSEDKLYRVYGSDNSFLGIGAFHEGSFRSFKNF